MKEKTSNAKSNIYFHCRKPIFLEHIITYFPVHGIAAINIMYMSCTLCGSWINSGFFPIASMTMSHAAPCCRYCSVTRHFALPNLSLSRGGVLNSILCVKYKRNKLLAAYSKIKIRSIIRFMQIISIRPFSLNCASQLFRLSISRGKTTSAVLLSHVCGIVQRSILYHAHSNFFELENSKTIISRFQLVRLYHALSSVKIVQ